MSNKKVNLSVNSLPKTFYVKYNPLAVFLIACTNVSTIFLIWDIRHKIFEDLIGFIITFSLAILSIYADLDILHALMKKQFVELTDEYIRVKKLSSDITLNWYNVESVEEIYSMKFNNVVGVKLKKGHKDKKTLPNRNITINFNKYSNINIPSFFKVLYKKKSNNFKIKF